MSEEKDIEMTFPADGDTLVSAPAADNQPVDSEVTIVYDRDENDEVIGWHKEAPTEGAE